MYVKNRKFCEFINLALATTLSDFYHYCAFARTNKFPRECGIVDTMARNMYMPNTYTTYVYIIVCRTVLNKTSMQLQCLYEQ